MPASFARGTVVVVAGAPPPHAPAGSSTPLVAGDPRPAITERVKPGMTGVVDMTDSQHTVHVWWNNPDNGRPRAFRRGVEAHFLQPVVGSAGPNLGAHNMLDATPGSAAHHGPVLLVSAGLGGIQLNPAAGETAGYFLQSFDPEAHDGHGEAKWTRNPRRAQVFDDIAAAFRFWRTVPASRPTRPDGQPNRPLTAYHVTFVPVPE